MLLLGSVCGFSSFSSLAVYITPSLPHLNSHLSASPSHLPLPLSHSHTHTLFSPLSPSCALSFPPTSFLPLASARLSIFFPSITFSPYGKAVKLLCSALFFRACFMQISRGQTWNHDMFPLLQPVIGCWCEGASKSHDIITHLSKTIQPSSLCCTCPSKRLVSSLATPAFRRFYSFFFPSVAHVASLTPARRFLSPSEDLVKPLCQCFFFSLSLPLPTSAELSAKAGHLLRHLHWLEVCLLSAHIHLELRAVCF